MRALLGLTSVALCVDLQHDLLLGQTKVGGESMHESDEGFRREGDATERFFTGFELTTGVLRRVRMAEPARRPEGYTGKRVAIVGAVRDAAGPLPHTLAQIRDLCAFFAACDLIFFENDSRNSTLDILRQSSGTVLSEEHLDVDSRVARIAYARNKLLEGVAAIQPAPEFMIMVDMDECVSLKPPEAIARALRSANVWDAMSYDRSDYYDIFALRCEHHDVWKSFWDVDKTVQCRRGVLGLEPVAGTKVTEGADTYFRVHSAFNSVGVYKWPVKGGCTYSVGRRPDGGAECEHVGFHNCIREHGGEVLLASWGPDATAETRCGNRPTFWGRQLEQKVAELQASAGDAIMARLGA